MYLWGSSLPRHVSRRQPKVALVCLHHIKISRGSVGFFRLPSYSIREPALFARASVYAPDLCEPLRKRLPCRLHPSREPPSVGTTRVPISGVLRLNPTTGHNFHLRLSLLLDSLLSVYCRLRPPPLHFPVDSAFAEEWRPTWWSRPRPQGRQRSR